MQRLLQYFYSMICKKVSFDSPWILKIYALRQNELRIPIDLNLFEEDLLSEQNEFFFAGIKGEELISCLQLREAGKGSLKLRQMATANNYQGTGKGRELVVFAEEWAAKSGYHQIELHARQVAQGFYEKIGYQKIGAEFLEVNIPHFKMVKDLKDD